MFATVLKSLAVLAVVTFPLSILATRLELIHFRTAFDFITWSVVLAIVIFVLGTIIGFTKSATAPDLARAGRMASMLSLIPIFILGNQMIKVRTLPSIHNISTDVSDPPQFVDVPELRGPNTNALEFDPELVDLQLAAYPNVKTFLSDKPVQDVFEQCLEIANELGWSIVSTNQFEGIIEATETTRLWGFKDDVVIRVQQQDTQTAVDLRSVSRVGQSDIGANAKRIERFLDRLSSFENK